MQEDATTRSETFTATAATTATTPIVIDATYDTAFYSSVVVTPGAMARTFSITATTRSDLSTGTQSSPIQLRACRETACTNIYAGPGATYTLAMTVTPSEWVTYQRNAAHTGYVPATLDPVKFTKAWEVPGLSDPNREGGLIAVSGSVYFTVGHRLYSLNEATGAQNWMYEPADAATFLGAPGYHNGRIYLPFTLTSPTPTFTGDSTIRGIDAATGAPLTNAMFDSTGGGVNLNSPTFQAGAMYFLRGEFQRRAYRFALPAGTTTWDKQYVGDYLAAQTPAVDESQVYLHVVNGLVILDKATGEMLPGSAPYGGSTVGDSMSPVLTEGGHVIGRDYFDGNRLIAIDRRTRARAWTGRTGYPYQPITAGNVIYAFHADNNATIDAISDTDGTVLWSIPVPKGETLGSYPDSPSIGPYENMILTDNMLFFGTQKNVYAVDLTTRQTVWSYPVRGQMVLSSGMVLYIFERIFMGDSRVIAIKLT
ncbi:MAG: PQQ-binding-like beta-propeller repeat protein [Hyphomonadaceae bacterium]|nr:PQQ-binding-like beta-propeller repeat protein [Hyphomonadaceae bacterium]